jgi:hypothetical protein
VASFSQLLCQIKLALLVRFDNQSMGKLASKIKLGFLLGTGGEEESHAELVFIRAFTSTFHLLQLHLKKVKIQRI